jgi:hypothetical protein
MEVFALEAGLDREGRAYIVADRGKRKARMKGEENLQGFCDLQFKLPRHLP